MLDLGKVVCGVDLIVVNNGIEEVARLRVICLRRASSASHLGMFVSRLAGCHLPLGVIES